MTKLFEATSFSLFYLLLSKSGLIFKTHFGSSLVEAMEAFTDVTKLSEAFGCEMWCIKLFVKLNFNINILHFNCHVTFTANQLFIIVWDTDRLRDGPHPEGFHSVGLETLKMSRVAILRLNTWTFFFYHKFVLTLNLFDSPKLTFFKFSPDQIFF